jgi:hypothetical protein
MLSPVMLPPGGPSWAANPGDWIRGGCQDDRSCTDQILGGVRPEFTGQDEHVDRKSHKLRNELRDTFPPPGFPPVFDVDVLTFHITELKKATAESVEVGTRSRGRGERAQAHRFAE